MKPNSMSSPSYQTGFSLVEIMVGLTIGMLATLVIVQVMSVFETQKRVTTGTADAQTNGSIALYNIGREMKIAGYPVMPVTNPAPPSSPYNCTTLFIDGIADTSTPNRLSPVTIIDGVSDTITIRYGDSLAGGVPSPIGAAPVGNDVSVGSNFGCRNGDRTLITNGAICAMSSASAVPAAGAIGSAVQTSITLQNTNTAATGANLACLGAWHEVAYRVNNGNLERQDLAATPNTFIPDMEGIVNLQAQYGISTAANSNQIAQWVNATGAWAAPTVANRNLIKAVRIAVVARNPKLEADAVTTSLNAWAGSASSPEPTIDLSADTKWQRYRYRVFETIIPLRNMIWSWSTL